MESVLDSDLVTAVPETVRPLAGNPQSLCPWLSRRIHSLPFPQPQPGLPATSQAGIGGGHSGYPGSDRHRHAEKQGRVMPTLSLNAGMQEEQ